MTQPGSLHADALRSRTLARLLAVAVAILVMFALRATRAVTLPLAMGIAFAILAWPVQKWVAARAPRALGILAAVLSMLLVIGGIFALLGWSGSMLVDRAKKDEARITALRARVAALGARVGIQVPGGASGGAQGGTQGGATSSARGGGSGGGDSASATGGSAGGSGGGSSGGTATRLGGALFGTLTSLALAVGFAALALAELDAMRKRVRARLSPESAEQLLETGGEIAGAVRHYFGAKTATSLLTGTCTGLFTLAVGLDLAWIWGMLAFLLEYVPSVGSLIAVVPPTIFAFIQFDGITKPLAIAGGLTVLQLILGNFVDPKLEGRFMSVSPLVVLLSIVFWAWVWGPLGALLGVPITVAITIAARRSPGMRWLWAVLTEQDKDEREQNDRAAVRR